MMLPLIEHIEKLFKTKDTFIDKDKKLYIPKILEAIEKLDKELISLLLSDDIARKDFFLKVNDVYVLEQNKLIEFFTMNEYMQNSFTAYTNKIGLIKKDNFIKKFDDVVLAFPYKDCVLEGGQKKDDEKNNEVFYNEIISANEIDRLFDKKVLTNFKRFDKDGEHKVEKITEEDNLILKGNNLIALHSLKEKYANKVKLIYIDPPYNTGKDSFNYNDRFNHSTWLTFMKNRLEIAKEFLKDDGVIFISIDDSEQAYLKILMDEIFGDDNFLLTITVNRPSEIASNYTISKHEYILVYSKTSKINLDFPSKYTISRGTVGNKNQTMPIIEFPAGLKCINIDDGIYTKTRQKKDSMENIENLTDIIVENGKLKFPIKLKARWRSSNDMRNFFNNQCQLTKAKISGYIEEIYFKDDTFNPQIKKLTHEKLSSLYLNNKRGSKDLEDLNLKNSFENPKRVDLIKNYIKLANHNDIVMDFFAGSGTTAQAVLEINKEQNKNLKFILIEQMDYIENITMARVKKVINNNKQGSFIYAQLKEIDNFKNSYIGKLNKNMQYLPLDEIEDETYNISKEDIKLNKQFYGIENE